MKRIILTKRRYTHQEVEKIIINTTMINNKEPNIMFERDFSREAQKKGRKNRFVPLEKNQYW